MWVKTVWIPNSIKSYIIHTIHFVFFDLALKKWQKSSYYEHDIALIELDEPFKDVTPICLKKRNENGLKRIVKKEKFIVAGKLVSI